MNVKQAMHKGVEWVSPTTSLADLAKLMKKHDIGAVPIGDHDKLVGMVTDRDMVCRGLASGGDASTMTASDVMTKGVTVCREDHSLDEAVKIMEQKKLRRLPVLDANKRMVGMLSLGDISSAASTETSGNVLEAVSDHH